MLVTIAVAAAVAAPLPSALAAHSRDTRSLPKGDLIVIFSGSGGGSYRYHEPARGDRQRLPQRRYDLHGVRQLPLVLPLRPVARRAAQATAPSPRPGAASSGQRAARAVRRLRGPDEHLHAGAADAVCVKHGRPRLPGRRRRRVRAHDHRRSDRRADPRPARSAPASASLRPTRSRASRSCRRR